MSSPAGPWIFDSSGHCTIVVPSTPSSPSRSYLVHIPAVYTPSISHPLVLSFHGFSSRPSEHEERTGFSESQAKLKGIGIVAVYPEGLVGIDVPGQKADRSWQGAPYARPGVDDVSFTLDIITSARRNLSIDSSRIYITGFSNGGGFLNLLARTPSVSSQIAAFVAGSAAFYDGTYPSGSPPSTEHPEGNARPIVEIHGRTDPNVPYDGRKDKDGDVKSRLPAIKDWLAGWAIRNGFDSSGASSRGQKGLPAPTSTTHPFPDVTLRTWRCPGDPDVLGYEVEGMQHVWARRRDGEAIDALTDVCLPLFEKHVLRDS